MSTRFDNVCPRVEPLHQRPRPRHPRSHHERTVRLAARNRPDPRGHPRLPLGTFTPSSPLASRSGVLPGSPGGQFRISGFTVTGTSTMTVSVSPGRAIVQGTESQGAYPVALTEYATLTFSDGDAQYPRIDLVAIRVYDDLYDGSGRTEATVEIVEGVPAASPSVRTVTGLILPLYQVVVPARASAGTGGITWDTALTGQRTATVAIGGILPVTTDTAPGAYPGHYRDNSGSLERWDGTAWRPYPCGSRVAELDAEVDHRHRGRAALLRQRRPPVPLHPVRPARASRLRHRLRHHHAVRDRRHHQRQLVVHPAGARGQLPQCFGFAALNLSTPLRAVAQIRCVSSTQFELEVTTAPPNGTTLVTGLVDAITPWVWNTSSNIRGTATYEAAV